jgi:hypothetical protein
MRTQSNKILVATLVLFMVSACGGDDPAPDDSRGVPSEEVRVMGESARSALSTFDFDLDNNAGELRFDASNAFAQKLRQGRIIASRPIDGVADAGLLQKVTGVQEQGDEIVVTTRQATLAEAFKRADIDLQRDLNGDDVEETQTLKQGVTFQKRAPEPRTRRQAAGQPFQLNFDRVLIDGDGDKDTTDDQLKLNGNVQFGASFDTKIKIGAFKLKRFLFAVNIEESVNLEVTGDFEGADFRKTEKISQHNLKTIVFNVAGVPVVIKIDLIIKIGIDGTIKAELRASAEQSASVRLGADFKNGEGWRGINETDSQFNVPPPEFNLSSVNARGFARPQVEITLYGLAGPYLFTEPFVRFDAELYRSPYWKLSGGLDFGVGFVVKVPVLGEVANWEKSFPVFEEPITESSNRAPSLTVQSPADGATRTAGGSVGIEVTAQDREDSRVDIEVRASDGSELASTTATEGETVTLAVDDLCQGTQTFNVVATDDDGKTTTATRSVIVENATPSVTIDTSTLTGMSAPAIFPGGYMAATTDEVDDPRCSSADPVDLDRVAWYLDGRRIARTADLLQRLSPNDYMVGDMISLQARFDDGQATGSSETVDITLDPVPAGDVQPEVKITQCNVCDSLVTIGVGTDLYSPNEITLKGQGFDPKEGTLAGDSLQWEIEEDGSPTRQELGRGENLTFKMDEVFSGPGAAQGTHTIYLTVTDANGNEVTTSTTFQGYVPG